MDQDAPVGNDRHTATPGQETQDHTGEALAFPVGEREEKGKGEEGKSGHHTGAAA